MLPWVDVATGSLGQGLPDGVGVALAGQYLDRLPYRVWVLCGDSEMAEGSIWEALDKASLLPAVQPDRDRRRQPPRPARADRARVGPRRLRSAGPRPSAPACCASTGTTWPRSTQALARRPSASDDRPTVILAATVKGRGFSEVEDREGWHGKPFPPDMAPRAIAELGGERNLRGARAAAAVGVAAAARRRGGRWRAGVAGATTGRRQGRDPQGLRRRAASPSAARDPRRRRARRRGQQLDPRRRVRQGLPGPLLRDVHRRAAARRRRGRAQRPRTTSRSRRRSRRSSPAPTTSSGWRPSRGRTSGWSARTPASRSAPTGRPRWRLEDLADDARRAGLDRALPERRDEHRRARATRWPTSPGISYLRTTRGAYPVLYDSGEHVPGRRHEGAALRAGRRGDARRRGRHRARMPRRGRPAGRPTASRPGSSTSTRSSPSTRDAGRDAAAAPPAAGSSSPRTTTPRAASAPLSCDALLADGVAAAAARPPGVRELPGSGTPAELLAAAGIDAQHIEAAARSLLT